MSIEEDEDRSTADEYSHPYDVHHFHCQQHRTAHSANDNACEPASLAAAAVAAEELSAGEQATICKISESLGCNGNGSPGRYRWIPRQRAAERLRGSRRPTGGAITARRNSSRRSPRRQRSRRRHPSRREQKVITSGRKSRARRSRDPDKPRRPASAFILFMQDFRRQHSATCKGVPLPNVSKIGARVWRSLSLKKKCEYQQQANARYESYKERLDEYRASHKRPDTAYQIFLREYYRAHKASVRNSSPSDVLARGARKWKRMTLSDKKPYMKYADERQDGGAPDGVATGTPLYVDSAERRPPEERRGGLLDYLSDRFCGDKAVL